MKITPAHRAQLVEEISKAWTRDQLNHASDHYGQEETRKLFDIFYSLPGEWRRDWTTAVYSYADDTHITTALRAAFKQLTGGKRETRIL